MYPGLQAPGLRLSTIGLYKRFGLSIINAAGYPARLTISAQAPFRRENTLRKQARRSFTVEIKQSTASSRSFIPPKPPQGLRRGQHLASPTPSPASVFDHKVMPASGTGEAVETRRILPSLIVWEPSAPEPEFEVQPESPLPRVRRAVPLQEGVETPRRRGRPPKLKPEPAPPADTAISTPSGPTRPRLEVSVPSRSTPGTLIRHARSQRIECARLPRAERWKRRLPQACW